MKKQSYLTKSINSVTNDCFFLRQNSGSSGNGVQYDIVSQQGGQYLAFCLGFENNVDISDEPSSLPSTIAITSIRPSQTKVDEVTFEIFDIGGSLIKSLFNGSLPAGTHSPARGGTNEPDDVVSSGIYFYRQKYAGFKIVDFMLN